MKRLAIALALVAMGACQKAEQKPAQAPAMAAPDTSHAMMQMSDTSKKMQMPMADTAKKPMAPAAPAAKPAPKKKP
ncbi:MAG TPA: hypothetical protein VEU55_04990 [Gemmatimonadales bacterium]|nr:hypothetical protein [Gemmatimonadales bacterium]